MRQRPDISLELDPSELLPGHDVDVTLVFQSGGETPYDGIRIGLRGEARSAAELGIVLGHDASTEVARPICALRADLPAGVLPKGVSRQTARLKLPQDLPPTYGSSRRSISYEVSVHVDIPWWPDARDEFTVRAGVFLPRRTTAGPVYEATSAKPVDQELYLEAALRSNTLAVGGRLIGVVSLANVHFHRVSGLDLELVTRERPWPNPEDVTERWHWTLHEGRPPEGTPLPFDLALPDLITPTFEDKQFALRHELRFRVRGIVGNDVALTIPVFYAPRGSLEPRPDVTLPDLGRTRFTEGWELAARRLVERGIPATVRGSTLVIDRGDGRVVRVHANDEKNVERFTAELTWPALGIDFELKRSGLLARSGIELPGLPFGFTCRAREPRQARALVDAKTAAQVEGFEGFALSDDGGRVTARGTPGRLHAPALDKFVHAVLALEGAIAANRAELPPPASLEACAPRLAALASAATGALRIGDLRVSGLSPRGIDVVIHHTFDGERATDRLLDATPPEGVTLPSDLAATLGAALHATVEIVPADASSGDPEDGNKPTEGRRVRVHLGLDRDVDDLDRDVATLGAALRRLAPSSDVGPYR